MQISLELALAVIAVVIPLTIAGLAFFLKRLIANTDESSKEIKRKQEIIDKRIDKLEKQFAVTEERGDQQFQQIQGTLQELSVQIKEHGDNMTTKLDKLVAMKLDRLETKIEENSKFHDAQLREFYQKYGPALEYAINHLKKQ